MIDNLYEQGHFGGIPRGIFNFYTDTDIEDDNIFVCELLEGYTDTDEEGYPYNEEDSATLVIDGRKIHRGIDSDTEWKRTMRTCVHSVLCSLFGDSYGMNCSFGTVYSKSDSMLIAQYLQRDYERMKRYNKPHSKKGDIIRELELDFRELTDKLISLYSPEEDRRERFQAKEKLEQYAESLSKRIDELEKELEELKARQAENRRDIETIEKELQSVENNDINPPHRDSKKAIVEEYIQGLEKTRQELNNKAQQEESTIPERIRTKAQPFIEKGLIEEVSSTNAPQHYRLLKNLTGNNFAWINSYLIGTENIEGLSLQERNQYIWSMKDKPLSKSSHNKNDEPSQEKFKH